MDMLEAMTPETIPFHPYIHFACMMNFENVNPELLTVTSAIARQPTIIQRCCYNFENCLDDTSESHISSSMWVEK